MEINLKLAGKKDIPTILSLMRDFYAIDGYKFKQATAENSLHLFLGNSHLGKLWLIKNEDKILGYVALTFGFSFEYEGRDAFIDELFLLEAYRGKGIGKLVMQQLENKASAHGVKAIHLEVENHNTSANRLYIKQGYVANERKLLTKKIDAD